MNNGINWHKWDLHVHTPESVLNNGFGDDWDEYVKILFEKAIENNISAIGITDYFSIDGYAKLKRDYLENDAKLNSLFNDEQLKYIKNVLILPNIEMRLSTFVGKNSNSINFHVIFSDKISIDDIQENFLENLYFIYEADPESRDLNKKINRTNITLLGDKLKQEQGFKESPYFVGMRSISVDYKSIIEVLEKNFNKEDYILALPCDEDMSNINWNSRDHMIRKNIYIKSQIYLTSSEKTINWALGKTYDNIKLYLEEFKSLKPCIVCSDAHNFENLFVTDSKKYTWIKAEISFNGLRQILLEPELRVKQQLTNPSNDKFGIQIEKIKISNNKIFNENDISFNSDMVAVIGEKGSGKSALLDMIGFALGDLNSQENFIKNSESDFKDSSIESKISNEDIITENFTFKEKMKKCRYINPQKLSQLCKNDQEMQDLLKSIIGKEYIKELEDGINFNTIQIRNDLNSYEIINKEISQKIQLENDYKLLNLKIAQHVNKTPEIINLEENIEKNFLKQKELIDNLEIEEKKVNKEFSCLFKFNSTVNELLNKKKTEIENFIFSEIDDINMEKDKLHINVEISEETKLYLTSLLDDLNTQKTNINTKISKEKPKFEELKKLVYTSDEQRKKFDIWNKELIFLNEQKRDLEYKLAKINACVDESRDLFNKIKINFLNILNNMKQMFKYYSEVKDKISSCLTNSPIKTQIKFIPKYKINELLLKQDIVNIFNMQKLNEETITKRISEIYCEKIKKIMEIDDINIEKINELLDLFISGNDDGILNKAFNDNLFKKNKSIINYYQIIFNNYISVNYEIRYNDLFLDQLSSGQKGTVLLKLLLKLDNDNIPLIIDQPEDNLDNKSVYDELVPEFRQIKQKRQLIIVTHNPNLVVNTDVEQVIIAHYSKSNTSGYINYESGSLENDNIKNKVCKILEGGKEAFQQREKKYGF